MALQASTLEDFVSEWGFARGGRRESDAAENCRER